MVSLKFLLERAQGRLQQRLTPQSKAEGLEKRRFLFNPLFNLLNSDRACQIVKKAVRIAVQGLE